MATLVSPSIARRSSLWAHLQRTQNGSSKMAFFRNLFLQYLSGNLTESDQIADSSTTLKGRQHGDIVSSHIACRNGLQDPKGRRKPCILD